MITIITCNYNSKDFAELLVKSVRKFSKEKYRILILDNTLEQEIFTTDDYEVVRLETFNIGHGKGLDYLLNNFVDTKYTLILDIDAHILRENYDNDIITILENDKNCGLIAPFRNAAKPTHPCVMFFRTDDLKNKVSMKPFYIENDLNLKIQMDVGQFVPIILSQIYNKNTTLLNWNESIYDNVHGATYKVFNKDTFFHFGYGTRLFGGNITKIGSITKDSIIEMKNNLFKQIKF